MAENSPGLEEFRSPTDSRRLLCDRKKLVDHQPGLLEALDRLVDPETRGDPMSPLRWTSKSTAKLAQELRNTGYKGRISEKCKRKAELLLPLRAKRGHAMANQDASAKSQTH